jgi:hypothetical protein
MWLLVVPYFCYLYNRKGGGTPIASAKDFSFVVLDTAMQYYLF